MQLSFLATDKTLLMKYKLVHKTTYTYGDAIHNYQCIVCLHPISSERQICEDFKLLIEPNPQNLYARKIILTIHNIIFDLKTPQNSAGYGNKFGRSFCSKNNCC
jgi:transglutaminase-like putative cysteine protease